MAKQIKYVQCTMKRTLENGSEYTTSYIPQKFAKRGRILKLKNDVDQWVDDWVVETVGHTIVDAADADYRKAIRQHRKATGDSQPRLK